MRAYVAVGSNLGDRWGRLAQAARALRSAPGVAVLRASRVWDAAPIGPPQPRYLNAVLELETTRTPASLLALLREVEAAAGRTRDVHWGARTLDLDLLLVGGLVVREPDLVVAHPAMEERRFVLGDLHCSLLEECGAGKRFSHSQRSAIVPTRAMRRQKLSGSP